MKYRLTPAIDEPQHLHIWLSGEGRKVVRNTTLEPNKVYETDDPVTIAWIKEEEKQFTYNQAFENRLKEVGANYRVELCRVCGGRKKKLFVHIIEEVE